jgi:hypothetical protein
MDCAEQPPAAWETGPLTTNIGALTILSSRLFEKFESIFERIFRGRDLGSADAMIIPTRNLLSATASTLAVGIGAGRGTVTETPVSLVTTSGQIVCNPIAWFAAIPGQPNMLVGRVPAIGSQTFCAAGNLTAKPALPMEEPI